MTAVVYLWIVFAGGIVIGLALASLMRANDGDD
jgi:hypothetical protein